MPRLRPALYAALAALACGGGAAPPDRVAEDFWLAKAALVALREGLDGGEPPEASEP